jgi:HD-like signal output (HDOD) protein
MPPLAEETIIRHFRSRAKCLIRAGAQLGRCSEGAHRLSLRRGNSMSQIERQREKAIAPSWAHLRLPPFPQVALRVLQLANNENVQLHQLSELISSDPAFASEVLTVANSLLYAPRFPANSVLQAIAVLGANNLQGLCLTVGVRGYMGKALNCPVMRAIWRHNLATALIADQVASVGFMDRDFAYTSGVMHDIGRLALAVIRPMEYTLLLQTHSGSPASILKAEHAVFGWNHCEAGRQLVIDWKLPSEFEAIAAEHHAPRQKISSWGMVELMKVSCRMADAAGFPAFQGCEVTPFPDLLDELPARERSLFHATIEPLAFEIAKKINAVESV